MNGLRDDIFGAMSDEIKLVGYSSDDLAKPDFPMNYKERVIYNGNMNSNRFGKPIKSKKQKREERQNGLFSKVEPLELSQWFVYLVDGEKWYYKVQQSLSVLRMHHKAEFLGIGTNKDFPLPKEEKPTRTFKRLNPYGKCCYCEISLTAPTNDTSTSKTRDHIIPRNRGGKIIKDCCYGCNQEKGGLMLHSYIQMLNLLWAESVTGSHEYNLLQTKIRNANKIAIEISKL